MFKSRIFTLYPDYFPGYLEKGLFGKAMKEKIWSLEIVDIRNYAEDKHKTVDDTPYGGGDGMIMKADVLARSLDKNLPQDEKIIYLSPKGKVFDHNCAKRFSEFESINFICGHFEGIDQRIIDSRNINIYMCGRKINCFIILNLSPEYIKLLHQNHFINRGVRSCVDFTYIYTRGNR